VAGAAGRRNARASRTVALLAVTAAVLGVGSAAGAPVPAAGDAALHVVPAESLRSAVVDLRTVRPELPRGYGTVEQRAAQAAAEQAAAAAAQAAAEAERAAAERAAAEAAARAAAPAAPRTGASSRATTPKGPTAPKPSAPAPTRLPLGVDPGSSTQVVTVVAASSTSTTATLTAWELRSSGWTAVLGPVTARVGKAGVGRASEGSTRTPAGTFTLTEAFGRAGDPGTALPYRTVDGDDWWVSDVNSPLYNRYAQCAPSTCPFDESVSENLYATGPVYDQAVVIDYNRGGTPGAGSGFFLHITNGAPTAGCVAIDAGSLVAVMRWLDPGARPLISIGVG
jgi:L,D-peptidoglycan transpeptidase YkuD (ErfK/YbiS/YcfS/YnhG family)